MTVAGFYGKLAGRGDFVSRGLAQPLIQAWDAWLAGGIAASQAELGPRWLETYLVSPLWRFAVPAPLLGTEALIGVMMPSVDRVGRYFPLSILLPLPAGSDLAQIASGADDWFEQAEALLLSTLDEDAEFEVFEAAVSALGSPACVPAASWQALGNGLQHCPADLPGERLLALAGCALECSSLWWGRGSERVPAGILRCAGMPAASDFARCLLGGDAIAAQVG